MMALSQNAFSAEGGQEVIIKYKTYEKVDLGGLDIKGEIVAPGDLSVMERGRKVFESELLNKLNLHDYIERDHGLLR